MRTQDITIHIPFRSLRGVVGTCTARRAVERAIENKFGKGSEAWLRDKITVFPSLPATSSLSFEIPEEVLDWLESTDERDCTFVLRGVPGWFLSCGVTALAGAEVAGRIAA